MLFIYCSSSKLSRKRKGSSKNWSNKKKRTSSKGGERKKCDLDMDISITDQVLKKQSQFDSKGEKSILREGKKEIADLEISNPNPIFNSTRKSIEAEENELIYNEAENDQIVGLVKNGIFDDEMLIDQDENVLEMSNTCPVVVALVGQKTKDSLKRETGNPDLEMSNVISPVFESTKSREKKNEKGLGLSVNKDSSYLIPPRPPNNTLNNSNAKVNDDSPKAVVVTKVTRNRFFKTSEKSKGPSKSFRNEPPPPKRSRDGEPKKGDVDQIVKKKSNPKGKKSILRVEKKKTDLEISIPSPTFNSTRKSIQTEQNELEMFNTGPSDGPLVTRKNKPSPTPVGLRKRSLTKKFVESPISTAIVTTIQETQDPPAPANNTPNNSDQKENKSPKALAVTKPTQNRFFKTYGKNKSTSNFFVRPASSNIGDDKQKKFDIFDPVR